MNRKCLAITLSILLILATGAIAAPPVPPAPNPARPINDFADLLEPDVTQQMEDMALALKKASSADLVVVTVGNLGGYTIEEYALELFRQWGLGDRTQNNGVLLLINKENALAGQSGRVRIEVGYGLEGAIPDGKAGRILDDYVLPYWSKHNYSEGIYQGFMALAAAIAEEYEIDLASEQDLALLETYSTKDRDFPLWLILFIIIVIIMLSSRSNRYPRKYSRRRSPFDDDYRGGPFIGGGFGGGGFKGGGGFGGFGGGSSGGGGASR